MASARYFCEHCGLEVPRDAKYCSSCGRFFSAVRCPRCDYSGAPSAFRDGCPVCGYSAGSPASELPELPVKSPNRSIEALPPWVYAAALTALLAAMAVFFFAASR